jgi:hypothetical protein
LGKRPVDLSGILSCAGWLSTGTVNNSVLTSQGIVNCVASVLLNLLTTACPQYGETIVGSMPSRPANTELAQATQKDAQDSNASPIPIPKETPEEGAERMRHRASLANERISVSALDGDVPLGSPVDIDVKFAPGQIADINVAQFKPHGTVRGGIEQSEDIFKIIREEGQTKTLEVVPMQLGSIDLYIGAVYADNTMAQQTIKLNVVPSSKGLTRFAIDGGGRATVIVMGDEEKERRLWLKPFVTYKQVKYPIQLEDSTQIKLSVEQDENDPVLRVDPNGLVHALHEGTAIIVGDFVGHIDKLKVTVYSEEDAPAGYGIVRQ